MRDFCKFYVRTFVFTPLDKYTIYYNSFVNLLAFKLNDNVICDIL